MDLKKKRAYEAPSKVDGVRILIDRLWPRGLSKADTKIAHWFREIAPSTELRRWFDHDPERWQEFQKRYRRELDAKPELVSELVEAIGSGTATLVFGSKEERYNNAVALKQYLEDRT